MTEEAKQNQEAQKPKDGNEPQTVKKSKMGGLIKYAIFGVVGLVVVLGIAFGTMMFIGGSETTEAAAENQAETTVETETHGEAADRPEQTHKSIGENARAANTETTDDEFDLAFLEQDEAVLDEILAALEVLDYNPESDVTTGHAAGMSIEDSIAESKWLDEEKAKLAQREKDIEAREKRLNVLDSKIQQQIVRIEQAESTRIGKLAKLYDGMDPQSVARLVANLDDATVVSLLPRMKLKNASSTLALMPPVRAARLSKQMITIAEN